MSEIGKKAAGPYRLRALGLLGMLLLVLASCSTTPDGSNALHIADKSGSGPEFVESGEPNEFEESEEFDELDEFNEFEKFDEFGTETDGKIRDPLSGYNRFMTKVNDRIYFWVLKPAASGYSAVTPRFVRKSVNRFFKNLGFPVRFVNNVLQLKFKRAGVETSRFLVNSTVGLAGLADPADRWFDLEAYPEDFGQTLGVYGLGPGFHIVLPVLGPSNLRDSLALIPDGFMEPTYYVEPAETAIAIKAYNSLNYTSLHLGEYESLKKDAVDWYIFLRNAYESNRQKKIKE
ncbi:MAG: VacJ family lipoprotein [Desulfobacteraceae bacterium]|nr:VacJ family lipoprotein [Desulfobacteraceae bacterium]